MCIVIVNDYLLRAARKSDEMLEPYEGKLSRTVLREEGGSNTTNLLDYVDIGRAFDAQVIDIYPGTKTHFNLMDIPDQDKLRDEDKDFVGQKSFCNFAVEHKKVNHKTDRLKRHTILHNLQ